MHVGFFAPVLPDRDYPNGIVTYTRIMRDALRSSGHRVTVVSPDEIEHTDGRVADLPRSGELIRRVETAAERLHGEDGTHPSARVRIIKAFLAARAAGVDVFEIEESFGWPRRLVGRGVPIVERLHGPHVFIREPFSTTGQQALSDKREKAELDSFTAVKAVTAPTQRLLDGLAERYKLTLPLARVVPNPIRVARPDQCWDAAKANADRLLFVGRFDHCKGADVVIQSFAQALAVRPSLKLVFAGPDVGMVQPDGTRVHFAEYMRANVAPHVAAAIDYLGTQPPERIDELRRTSALTIVASRFENFPYSVAEPMAMGMPILTTNTFGGSELIRHDVDGLVVPVGDVDATVRAMLAIVGNPHRAVELGRSAYERAAALLDPERIAKEAIAVYRTAIASH